MKNTSSEFFEEIDTVPDYNCEECGAELITTRDGTVCCPECGLVVGSGYSWIGSSPLNVPKEPDEEDIEWNGAIDNGEKALEDAHW